MGSPRTVVAKTTITRFPSGQDGPRTVFDDGNFYRLSRKRQFSFVVLGTVVRLEYEGSSVNKCLPGSHPFYSSSSAKTKGEMTRIHWTLYWKSWSMEIDDGATDTLNTIVVPRRL